MNNVPDVRVLKDPAPVVAVFDLDYLGVKLVCRPWVKPENYWDVHFAVSEKVKVQLDQNEIKFATAKMAAGVEV